jgi:4-hydroxyphenylacetaldehyde oxime monooxygenase
MAAVVPLLSPTLLAGLPLQWKLFGILVLLPILLLSIVLLTRSHSSSSTEGLRLPPGPAPVPILGNLHQLGALPHRSLRELARRHGPVMLLRLGAVSAVVVSSAEAAREVTRTHDVDCCNRPASSGPRRLSYNLKDVAFAPYDEYWSEMRKLFIVELLSMRRVKAAWYAREQQVFDHRSHQSHLN